jgi:PTH1 family peptidyl-tRNA hydrolase
MADYVLQRLSAEQEALLPGILRTACDAVEALVTEGLTAAQQKIHPSSNS